MQINLEVRLPSGKTFPFEYVGDGISMGRDPDATLTFDDKDAPTVSWSHARLDVASGEVMLEDLKSSNGTFLNDAEVVERQAITLGDAIRLGRGGPVLRVTSLTIDDGPVKANSSSPQPFGFLPPEEPSQGPALSPQSIPPSPMGPAGHSASAEPSPGQVHSPASSATSSGSETRALLLDMQKRWKWSWLVTTAAISMVLLLVVFVLIALKHQTVTDEDLQKLAKRLEPSVVVIEADGLGSGFVFDKDGTIVTNYHVIEGATEATVKFRDGTSADVVGYVGVSPSKDLALLQVASLGKDARPLPLASEFPDKLSKVMAFGSPRGLRWSVTEGVVSAVRTGAEVRDNLRVVGGELYLSWMASGYDDDGTWVETTARIMHGNSGGPLVNLKGEVVGVNTWGPTDTLNFASSARNIRHLAETTFDSPRPLSELPPRR